MVQDSLASANTGKTFTCELWSKAHSDRRCAAVYQFIKDSHMGLLTIPREFMDMEALVQGLRCRSSGILVDLVIEISVWNSCCAALGTWHATASNITDIFPKRDSSDFNALMDETCCMFQRA